MTSHELAAELLRAEDLDIIASIDISTGDTDDGRRIFTDECFGINNMRGDSGFITILFGAKPEDNLGNVL